MRGSIPAPGASTSRFGGNTPCVEIRCGDQTLIFDLGSGVRNLGDHYASLGTPIRASVFVSHYHYDHLQGLPFFTPIFNPKNVFTFYGPQRDGKGVKDILAGQMVQPYFPVSTEVFRAQVEYRSLEAGQTIQIGEARISTAELNHPGGNLGYRIDYAGHSVVYATDVEHGSSELDQRLADFARGADLFICDAMYTEDEYLGRGGAPKTGWGHSTYNAAAKFATLAKVKKLVLFHHDPTRDDAAMDKLLRLARKLRPEAVAARESMVLDV